MKKSLFQCQRALAVVWFALAGIALVVLIAQTTVGNVFVSPRAGDMQARAWGWLLPSLGPTLALVLGVLANAELRPLVRLEAQRKHVSAFFYKLTIGLSLTYTALVPAMLLLTGLRTSAETKLELLENSHFFLAPLQSLVSLALGVFFLSPDTASHSANTGDA